MKDTKDWRDDYTWFTKKTRFTIGLKIFFRPLFQSMSQIDYIGLDNIPTSGPCILASNHVNNFDVFFYWTQIDRSLHFMAKSELFKNPLVGWGVRHLGAFPVKRGERDSWVIEQASRVLQAGQVLFIFPEGTRSGRKAQLGPGKTGAVRLAIDNQVPIVPAAIFGTHNFKPGWYRSNQVRVQFGEPWSVATEVKAPYEYETVKELTTLLMKKIAAMLPPDHRGVYAC